MPKFETFVMPDAGEGLTEADIVTWRVAVGDTVATNQPLVEVETAKSLVELPCPYDGLVTELLASEGDTVDVGAPIAVFDVDPTGEPPGPSFEGMPSAVPDEDPPAASADGPQGPYASGINVESPADAEGPVEKKADDSDASGSVLVGYGVSGGTPVRRPRRLEVITPAGEAPSAQIEHPVFAKPPVRKLAREMGIDLSTVTPSGPGGIITREDVMQHSQQREPRALATYDTDDQPWLESGVVSADGRVTRVPVKSVRKRTAEAMVSSAFTAPHVTVFHTLDVTATMDLVAKLKQDREFQDVRVTPLLIAAKALLFAVRRHPEINASWDHERQEIVYKHYVNLGIAASTPRGLIVPNVKDAHRYDLRTLAGELQELTHAARAGSTTPAAMQDGTITITNVGVFGIDTGTPILNPGEAAILAFGAIRQQPWVHEGEVQARWVTQLALSFDHRLVDGELGSRVLADVAAVMGDPTKALVWS